MFGASLAAFWTSCAAPQAAPPPRASDGAAAAEPTGGFADGFGTVEARGQGLELLLPNPEGWRVDPSQKFSWVVRHQESESILWARVWNTDAIVRPEDCERQARIWRPDLPRLAATEIVQSNAVRLAGDYDSRLTVGVRASTRAAKEMALSGHALAFGSAARSCLSLAFSTFASGPGARRSIADRLAVIVPTAFLRARRLGIERRVVVPGL